MTTRFFGELHRVETSVYWAVYSKTISFASYRLIAKPARANMFPLEAALLAESHSLWPTTLIKHGHSPPHLPSTLLCHHRKGHALFVTI